MVLYYPVHSVIIRFLVCVLHQQATKVKDHNCTFHTRSSIRTHDLLISMPPQKSITKAIAEVVSVLAFYSDDPSLKPTVFSVTFVIERNENNQKEAGWAI